MIFFIGVILMLAGWFIGGVLRNMGYFRLGVNHWTDLLCIVPFFGGVGCLLWSLGVLAVRWLP